MCSLLRSPEAMSVTVIVMLVSLNCVNLERCQKLKLIHPTDSSY